MKLSITSQEFGRGPVTTRRFSALADAAAYIADRWLGDEYRDGPASFHTDYCTYQCHGFTLEQVRPKPAPRCERVNACTDDSCDAGAHCRVCGGHFLDYHNSDLRGACCDTCKWREEDNCDCDGPGINGPEPVFQAGLDDGETGFSNGIHWSDPRADGPNY